jgi:hypothetical protein
VVDDEEFCIATMKALFESQGMDAENITDSCMDGKEAYD